MEFDLQGLAERFDDPKFSTWNAPGVSGFLGRLSPQAGARFLHEVPGPDPVRTRPAVVLYGRKSGSGPQNILVYPSTIRTGEDGRQRHRGRTSVEGWTGRYYGRTSSISRRAHVGLVDPAGFEPEMGAACREPCCPRRSSKNSITPTRRRLIPGLARTQSQVGRSSTIVMMTER